MDSTKPYVLTLIRNSFQVLIENINLLLSLLIFLFVGGIMMQLPAPSTIFAQEGTDDTDEEEAAHPFQNLGYEIATNGNYLKPWGKNPSTSNVYVETLKPRSGLRNAAMQPLGVLTTLRQKVKPPPRNSGDAFLLRAYVSTIQGNQNDPAYLVWQTNVTPDRYCGYSNAGWYANRYAAIDCAFDIPSGATMIRVKIKSDAPSGDWVMVDDWSLTPGLSEYAQAFSSFQFDPTTETKMKGVKAIINTGQPACGYEFVSSPLAVCRIPAICDGLFETGWTKGDSTGNYIKTYLTYRLQGGGGGSTVIFDEYLSQNTSYSFEIKYDDAAQIWKIYRGGVYKYSGTLNFTSVSEVNCGAEGYDFDLPADPPLSVECRDLHYRSTSGTWNPYDYNSTRTAQSYCVRRPTYSFGAIAEGPC